MAYLKPTKLTCPVCGLSGEVNIVVHVGPGFPKGATPAKSHKNRGSLADGPPAPGGEKTLACPADGTILWTDTRQSP